jgi:hypothetical protein
VLQLLSLGYFRFNKERRAVFQYCFCSCGLIFFGECRTFTSGFVELTTSGIKYTVYSQASKHTTRTQKYQQERITTAALTNVARIFGKTRHKRRDTIIDLLIFPLLLILIDF